MYVKLLALCLALNGEGLSELSFHLPTILVQSALHKDLNGHPFPWINMFLPQHPQFTSGAPSPSPQRILLSMVLNQTHLPHFS